MYNLKANIVIRTIPDETTYFMCIDRKILLKLLELYPKTRQVVSRRALERRMVFMERLDQLNKKVDEEKERRREVVRQATSKKYREKYASLAGGEILEKSEEDEESSSESHSSISKNTRGRHINNSVSLDEHSLSTN